MEIWIKETVQWLIRHDNWAYTSIVLSTGFILNWLTGIAVGKLDLTVDRRRELAVFIRNTIFLFVTIGILVIWFKELKTVALSVAAVGAGLIIVSKEGIMNIMGGFARASSQGVRIGDKVTINGNTGIVLEHTLSTTTLLETGTAGQLLGSAVVIPNAIYLTGSIRKLSVTEDYVMKTTQVPIRYNQDVVKLSDLLTEAANKVTEPYMAEAKVHMDQFSQKLLVEMPSSAPRVLISPFDKDTVHLLLRYAVPYDKQVKVEQEILRHFYSEARIQELLV